MSVITWDTLGAGYGLYALRACSPSSVLFSVPEKALMNVKTLSTLYPRGDLSAVQLISLYLAVHRPGVQSVEDPHFGPYIAVLPSDFTFHPLHWLIHDTSCGANFIPLLPPSISRALHELCRRYREDWNVVSAREHSVSRLGREAARTQLFRYPKATTCGDG